jgi:hypothetical protein
MRRALQSHKASLEAHREAFKMRSGTPLPPSREESPLFEPDDTAPHPLIQDSEHEDTSKTAVKKPTRSFSMKAPALTDQPNAAAPVESSRKRKGTPITEDH